MELVGCPRCDHRVTAPASVAVRHCPTAYSGLSVWSEIRDLSVKYRLCKPAPCFA